ncbi:MAG: hypothetical protein GY742_05195 [Hyphomicrobiales bacterium]|nr:hypothetical protein [Hyphomicrobiales bacterium]
MNKTKNRKLTLSSALRLEFGIIGLGVVALAMIFQPFSLSVFSAGCGLVVLAALANNLLPLAEPGTPIRQIIFAAVVVLLVFCTALLVAIVAAHLYGLAYLKAPAASVLSRVPAQPYWQHSLFWGLAIADAVLWFAVFRLTGSK